MAFIARTLAVSIALCTSASAQCSGSSWTVIDAPNGPSARYSAFGWYSPPNHGLIVFGGWCCGMSDMWLWNGSAWSQLNPAQRPAGRLRGAMAWDASRNVGVIHGGIGAWPYPTLSDTWEWNGAEWTQRTFAGPALHDHSMAYDEARAKLVLYGGRDASREWQNGTWEYDGVVGWQLRSNTPGIPPMEGVAMAFDRTRGRMVGVPSGMAHEALPTSYQTSAFEWDGSAWSPIATQRPSYEFVSAAWTDPESGSACFLGATSSTSTSPSSDIVFRLVGEQWEVQTVSSVQRRLLVVAGLDLGANKLLLFGGPSAPATVLELSTRWPAGASTAILTQPQAQPLVPGATATFAVTASGSDLTFQWRRDGQPLTSSGRISGTTTATLTITSVAAADQGAYDCFVSGRCGTATSAAARLSCTPIVTQQPQGGTFVGGQPVTLSVVAEGTAGATYRWRRDGVSLFNGIIHQGVTTPTLTIIADEPAQSGTYTVAITNACGTIISAAATIEVTCPSDFNNDGGIDGQDLFEFFDAWAGGLSNADLNFDGGTDGSDVTAFFVRWENGC